MLKFGEYAGEPSDPDSASLPAPGRPAVPDRVLFVDLARAAAVVFMIQGHTLQVLLGPGYQGGPLFNFWLYLRGLTSCAFLTLAGFSFTLATDRHRSDYRAASPRLRRRLARFAAFLVLGYAMRIPIRPFTQIGRVSRPQWQAFTAVDILQLVAVTLTGLQVLVCLTSGTRRRLGVWALTGATAIIVMTPLAWRLDATNLLPVLLGAYVSPATGSLFPLFPWAAYILAGAALGTWFVARPARDPGYPLLVAGAAMLVVGVALDHVPFAPYGAIDFWTVSPNLFLVKEGSMLILLSGAVRITRWRTTLPRIVSVLSRESLTIYFVHVCILYGSIWNNGLFQAIGPHLGLAATAVWVGALIAAMGLMAWSWHECKRRSAHLSAFIRLGVVVGLFYAIS